MPRRAEPVSERMRGRHTACDSVPRARTTYETRATAVAFAARAAALARIVCDHFCAFCAASSAPFETLLPGPARTALAIGAAKGHFERLLLDVEFSR